MLLNGIDLYVIILTYIAISTVVSREYIYLLLQDK